MGQMGKASRNIGAVGRFFILRQTRHMESRRDLYFLDFEMRTTTFRRSDESTRDLSLLWAENKNADGMETRGPHDEWRISRI